MSCFNAMLLLGTRGGSLVHRAVGWMRRVVEMKATDIFFGIAGSGKACLGCYVFVGEALCSRLELLELLESTDFSVGDRSEVATVLYEKDSYSLFCPCKASCAWGTL